MATISINGFDRLGRLGLRAGWQRSELCIDNTSLTYSSNADIEWGYVNRMMDIAQMVARSL